ncbi:hypothetical protein B0H13DRAFT_2272699 [Mycena leptocephala]|nr:hypothetical protein B0H13DRAFT_2272699 [Mycena leptocephala]
MHRFVTIACGVNRFLSASTLRPTPTIPAPSLHNILKSRHPAAPAHPPTSTDPPPPRRSIRERRPARDRTAVAACDASEDHTIAATPEDNDPDEAAMWTDLNAYVADNPIDVEFPDDPRNYTEAMASPDAEKWLNGAREELGSLREYVTLNKTILDIKPFYTRKRDMNGVMRNKIKKEILVKEILAHGFSLRVETDSSAGENSGILVPTPEDDANKDSPPGAKHSCTHETPLS